MTEHYILFVRGCVEPDVRGPFPTGEERDMKAKELFDEEGMEHGIYGLDREWPTPNVCVLKRVLRGAFRFGGRSLKSRMV